MDSDRHFAVWQPVSKKRVPVVVIGFFVGLFTWSVISITLNWVLSVLLARIFDEDSLSAGSKEVQNLFSFLMFAVSAVFGFTAAHRVSNHLANRLLSASVDNPDDQFVVSLDLYREVTYGFDEGLASFVDGWLVFSGRRCSFALKNSDVDWSNSSTIRFLGPTGPHRAQFNCPETIAFRQALTSWRLGPVAEGESLLPPVIPSSASKLLGRTWLPFGVTLLIVGGLFCVFQPAPLENRWLSWIMPVGAVCAFYGAQVSRAIKEIRAEIPFRRRRLAALIGIDILLSEPDQPAQDAMVPETVETVVEAEHLKVR